MSKNHGQGGKKSPIALFAVLLFTTRTTRSRHARKSRWQKSAQGGSNSTALALCEDLRFSMGYPNTFFRCIHGSNPHYFCFCCQLRSLSPNSSCQNSRVKGTVEHMLNLALSTLLRVAMRRWQFTCSAREIEIPPFTQPLQFYLTLPYCRLSVCRRAYLNCIWSVQQRGQSA